MHQFVWTPSHTLFAKLTWAIEISFRQAHLNTHTLLALLTFTQGLDYFTALHRRCELLWAGEADQLNGGVPGSKAHQTGAEGNSFSRWVIFGSKLFLWGGERCEADSAGGESKLPVCNSTEQASQS